MFRPTILSLSRSRYIIAMLTPETFAGFSDAMGSIIITVLQDGFKYDLGRRVQSSVTPCTQPTGTSPPGDMTGRRGSGQ
jgi:hypothetical protein